MMVLRTVGSLRNLLQAAALIAELLTLQSDIYQDDGNIIGWSDVVIEEAVK